MGALCCNVTAETVAMLYQPRYNLDPWKHCMGGGTSAQSRLFSALERWTMNE